MSYKQELLVNKLIKILKDTNADYETIIKARLDLCCKYCLNPFDPSHYYLYQHFEDTFNIKERITMSKADEINFYGLFAEKGLPVEITYKTH